MVASERRALNAIAEPMLIRERRLVHSQVSNVARVGHLFDGVRWDRKPENGKPLQASLQLD